jgi:hypothetical protein
MIGLKVPLYLWENIRCHIRNWFLHNHIHALNKEQKCLLLLENLEKYHHEYLIKNHLNQERVLI